MAQATCGMQAGSRITIHPLPEGMDTAPATANAVAMAPASAAIQTLRTSASRQCSCPRA